MFVSSSYSSPSGELQVAFINVGNGDSILIKTPSGFSVLIDGGEEGNERVIENVLKKFEITKR
ncbi:MAG: MBL fold metallo-hydrolase, partial [Spirochaetes bacterium]|nr:MBL fold metallo-hydrolase [Spirochaetota bacterium]